MTRCTQRKFGSLNRPESRSLIEEYCSYAYLLPIQEKMLFLLYYYDGYSTVEIAQLLMKHPTTVSRRIHNIASKLKMLMSEQV